MTIEFDEPAGAVLFSEITDATAGSLPPSVIGVNSRMYLLDTKSGEWKRSGINVVEQRNTTSNRDLLLLPQGVWRQMFESWHQGAGQSNLDRDDALPSRFMGSYGVDVWDRFHVKLLHDTDMIPMSTPFAGVPQALLTVLNGNLVVTRGAKVTFVHPDLTTVDLAVGTSPIVNTATDGEFLWTLHDDGTIYKTSNETTTAAVTVTWPQGTASNEATFIAYVKDYLIVGVGNVLFNITDPAHPVVVYTSPVPGFTWKGAVDGDRAIYLAGGAGDKHVVHMVKVADDGTRLMPALVAAALPDGEIAYSVGSYLGFVFVGTDKGVRMAVAGGDGALTLGAVIPTTAPVYGFEGQDRFVWYTNSQVPSTFGLEQEGFPIGYVPGLGRMDLTTFTTTEATPAYASDLVVEGGAQGTVRSVATWQGRRVFSVDGVGVFLESDHVLMEKGWITHGAVSFGVEDLKTALYAQFKWLPLDGSIGMFAAYDSSRYTELALKDVPDSVGSGNVSMHGIRFSRVNMGAVLHRDRDTDSLGPVLTRWEFRAVPVKGIASRWTLPIINRAELDINGQITHRDCRAELLTLMRLVQNGGMFPLQESGIVYNVTAKDFEWRPESLAPDGRSWQGTYVLVVEEIQ